MLWLALNFPWLPIEALPLRRSSSEPAAMAGARPPGGESSLAALAKGRCAAHREASACTDETGVLPGCAVDREAPPTACAVVVRGRIAVADAAALDGGVAPGQKLSTALGLLPGLAVFEREQAREVQALEQLACWAGCFTPSICLALPNELLLEIGACLRLFGGAEAIVTAVLAGCGEQGYSVGWAVAPTPLGARWLARSNRARIYPDAAAMQAALAELPCSIPAWPETIAGRLESFGLRTLGELRRLPTAGLRRRIGNAAVDDVLRAWGEVQDLQEAFVFPERFVLDLELPSRVEHAEGLLFCGQRLFGALAGWLQARQRLVRRCTLRVTHDDGRFSSLPLNFAEPSADEGRFLRLLREHLGRWDWPAPVEAVRLQADEVVERTDASAALFGDAVAGEGALACLERLRARLGEAAVRALAQVAEHRPECATAENFNFGQNFRLTVPDRNSPWEIAKLPAPGQRPLWLLPTPKPLPERAGCPQWYGPLKLLTRPERVESGWWDEGEAAAAGDIRRDYFVARNPQGQWAWVFRDAQGWFLHGLFA